MEKYGLNPKFVGKALNDPTAGGVGAPSPNMYVLWTAFYVAQGFSHRQIHSALVDNHGYKSSFSKFYKDFKIVFGSVHTAREIFASETVQLLKKEGIEDNEIDQLMPLLKKVDTNALLSYIRKGYELKDIPLPFCTVTLLDKLKEIIDEEYPDLKIYVRRENIGGRNIDKDRASWEDLRYFLLAQEIQKYAMEGLSSGECASKFYSPSKPKGFEKHLITKICKAVFKCYYNDLKRAYVDNVLQDIIINTNNPTLDSFTRDVRLLKHYSDPRGRSIARRLAINYIHDSGQYGYIHRKASANKDLTESEINILLDIVRYAVIGPALYNSYKNKLSTDQIVMKYGFFKSSQEVESFTFELFGFYSVDLIRLLINGDLKIDYVNRFGVKV